LWRGWDCLVTVLSIGMSRVGILYNVSSLHKSYINPIYTLLIITCTQTTLIQRPERTIPSTHNQTKNISPSNSPPTIPQPQHDSRPQSQSPATIPHRPLNQTQMHPMPKNPLQAILLPPQAQRAPATLRQGFGICFKTSLDDASTKSTSRRPALPG
jgi:hypothetical protein